MKRKKRKIQKRITAGLLAAAVFVTVPGMENLKVFAEQGQTGKEADLSAKTLIVSTTEENFDKLGAEECTAAGDGLYLLSYEDGDSTQRAYETYQKMDGIDFADINLVVNIQTEQTQERTGKKETEDGLSTAEGRQEKAGSGAEDGEREDSIKTKKEDVTEKEESLEETDRQGDEQDIRQTEDADADGKKPTAEQEEKEESTAEDVKNAATASEETEPEQQAEQKAEDGILRVALVDTGIKPDTGNLALYVTDTGINVSESGEAGSTMDDNGHGTAMAQILVSALEENGTDSGHVKILPIKAMDASGSGTILTAYQGMKAAMELDADIICLGFSGKGDSRLLEQAADEAYEKGITVVAPAGNAGEDISAYVPGCLERAVIAGNAKNKAEAGNSNHGETVDFAAYGTKDVLSLTGEAQNVQGTSVACAYVAGVAASIGKGLSCEEMESELAKRAEPAEDEALKPYFGKGLIGEVPEERQEEENSTDRTKEDETAEGKETEDTKKEKVEKKTAGETQEITKEEEKNYGTPAKGTAYIRYKAKYVGDTEASSGDWKNTGQTCGTTGENTTKKLEALKFEYVQNGSKLSGGIYYRTHVTSNYWNGNTLVMGNVENAYGGWTGKLASEATDTRSTWAKDGEWSGTTGKNKHLESYTLELYGEVKDYYCINYDAFGYHESYRKRKYGASEDCTPKESSEWYNEWLSWDTSKRDLKNSWKNWSDPGGTYSTSWNFAGTYMCTFPIQAVSARLQPFQIERVIDPNGGTYKGSKNIISGYKDANSSETISTPERTGYTFAGWTVTQTDLEVDTNNFNQTPGKNIKGSFNSKKTVFTYGNKNVMFRAKWTPNTYTVAYNGNGNTGGSTDNSTHTYDTAKNLTKNGFKRKFNVNYNKNSTDNTTVIGKSKDTVSSTFKNWNKKKDGSGTSYSDQQSVKNLTTTNKGTVNLYAQWKDDTVTFPSGTRDGYELLGWSTDKDTEKPEHKAGETFTVSKNDTFYAIWKMKTYTITYDANGGSGTMEKDVKKYGETYTIKKNAFLRLGYDFVGWSTKADGSGDSYNYNDPDNNKRYYSENADITLYAQWRENFKAAYIGNGQTKGSDFIDEGENKSGYSEDVDYIFDGNTKKTGGEENITLAYTLEQSDSEESLKTANEQFAREETVTYKDSETGKDVEQKITGTVVGWSMKKTEKEDMRGLGEIVLGGEVVADSQKKDNLTIGSPNSDYGKFREDVLKVGVTNTYGVQQTAALQNLGVGTAYNGTPYVNRYAVWDMGPVIEAYDRYYTLEEAQKGFITEDELLNAAKATDEEVKSDSNPDGRLKNHTDEENHTSFEVYDYQAEEFTGLHGSAVISVTYHAEDAAGNVTKKMILVHIVDGHDTVIDGYDIGREPDEGEVRFISEKYLDTLDEDSIWVTDAEYAELLKETVSIKRVNPKRSEPVDLLKAFGDKYTVAIPGTGTWTKEPKYVWNFTHEQKQEVKKFIEEHGPSNFVEEDALEKFIAEFLN